MKWKDLPFGRVNEYVATLTDDQKQRTAIRPGRSLGSDDRVQTWPNRKVMAKLIRRQEKTSPRSEWIPLIKLTDGEGYS